MRVVALLLALLALPALGQDREINPCNFTDLDSPCRIEGGVYRALIPQGPGPHPAVIYLYGSLGRSKLVTDAAYFRREVVRRGYALIVPAALDTRYRGGEVGTGWGRRARAAVHPRDDVDFIQRVIRDAGIRHQIDTSRLIFAGQSDGGFFIWELACHRPEIGAAFAVHAGSYGGPLPRRCRRPVRFLQTHGTQDDVVPIKGELRYGPFVEGADVRQGLALLAETNGCRSEPVAKQPFHRFDRLSWQDCAPGSSLEFLIHKGGHSWPATWMPAVLDWFERTSFKPAVSVTRRVGDGEGPARLQRAGEAAGGFRRAPATGGSTGIGGFKRAPAQ